LNAPETSPLNVLKAAHGGARGISTSKANLIAAPVANSRLLKTGTRSGGVLLRLARQRDRAENPDPDQGGCLMDDSPALKFGPFELQARHRRLLRDGEPLPVGARAFDVLLALAERRERIVTKAELMDLAWPGLVVEENNLQVQISSLRKLLGPDAIATIPGRGYRFTAALAGHEEAPSIKQRLAAIMAADVAGCSRLTGAD
jgi:DNA-binding winged helix-turn-helix (wHTH) protein